jgi:hypothetical protein
MKKLWTHRPLRITVAGLATLAMGAALASAGVAGLRALDSGSAAAKQYPGKKVTICHRTHSKKHPWVRIRVSVNAQKAHLGHGDFVVDATHPSCPPATVAATSKKNKHEHGNSAAKKQQGKSAAKKQQGKSATKKQHGKSATKKQQHAKSAGKQQQGNSAAKQQHGNSAAKKQHGKSEAQKQHGDNGGHQGGNDSHPDHGKHGKK